MGVYASPNLARHKGLIYRGSTDRVDRQAVGVEQGTDAEPVSSASSNSEEPCPVSGIQSEIYRYNKIMC